MRVNERIREREVRVIDNKGENLGVMETKAAIDLAKERGLDLVEVSSNATPKVCKIVDYGKYHYQQAKRQRKQRHRPKLKEMKFTIKIGEHDFQTKLRRVREFLSKGDTVRVSVFFRGREVVHAGRGRELLKRVATELSDIARVDEQPRARGRMLQMLIVPNAQPKQ